MTAVQTVPPNDEPNGSRKDCNNTYKVNLAPVICTLEHNYSNNIIHPPSLKTVIDLLI